MNPRYQKYTEPKGQTRKSAAAAKPKKAGSSSSSKGSSSPKKSAPRQALITDPPTEEYKRLRRIWWILLLSSVACTGGSLAARKWLPGQTMLAGVLLGLGYAGIFSALYLDLTKLRRMRTEWANEQKSGKASKPPKAEKTTADNDTSDDK